MTAPARERPLGRIGRVALIGLLVAGTVLAAADPFTLYFFLPYAAVGAFLAVRRPTNSIAWLLIAMAFGWITTTASPDLDVAALARGDGTIGDNVVAWIRAWGGWATFVGILALTIVFPNGFPDVRERRIAMILLGVGIADVILAAFAPTMSLALADGVSTINVPNPFSVLPDLPIWSLLPVLTVPWIISMVVGVVRMVLRYRRSVGVERLQLRWLVAAVVFVLVGLIIGLALSAIAGDQIGDGAWIAVIFAYPTIPLAIGFAVMRYRLFEIDRIVSRTLAYSAVTVILGALFGGMILGLQALLAPITSGDTIAVAASTLAVFALFQPVLRRVRGSVDRRFDRARYDADLTVRTFAARLRGDIDLGTVRTEILDTATAAVRPTNAGVWLRVTQADRARP